MNMSCYMSDDEALALPRVSELSSPIGGSVSVLDMINQDVMFGNSCHSQGAKSSATTQVTYVRDAPSAPSTSVGDLLLPPIPYTTAGTSSKPLRAYAPQQTSSREVKNKTNQKPAHKVEASKATCTSINLFEINPFVSNQNQVTKDLFAATTSVSEKGLNASKKSPSSNKKSKNKGHGKRTSQPKSPKKTSSSDFKSKNAPVIALLQSNKVASALIVPDISSVAHTIVRTTTQMTTRTTNVATESRFARSTGAMTRTTTSAYMGSVTSTTSSVTTNIKKVVDTKGTTAATQFTTSTTTTHTVAESRTPVSIMSPFQATYLPTSFFYSTPTIITRTPSTSAAGEKACEQYSILPAPVATEDGGRPRTRLVIPVTINSLASSTIVPATTAASTSCKRRTSHAARSAHTLGASSSAASDRQSKPLIAVPPGPTLCAAKKQTKTSRPPKTEPQTFTIVDSRKPCRTHTITPNFTLASANHLDKTQATITSTSAVTNTSYVASGSVTRPRNQLFIPIVNSQMNTNTGLGYLVTSPIGQQPAASTASPSTTVSTHTITTISSEALNRIRTRLICNVSPNVASGSTTTLPSSTIAGKSSPARGPVTIFANQLISSMARNESTAPSCEPAARPVSRVVIPFMSNVHTVTTHSAVATQGRYIIAGVNPTTNEATSRAPRLVIPVIHNASGAAGSTSTTAAATGSKSSPAVCVRNAPASMETNSKLRSRLTVKVTDNETVPKTTSPITTYTITKHRVAQNVYTIPARNAPYVAVTKASDPSRKQATMAVITFSPPGASSAVSNQKKTSGPPSTAEPGTKTIASGCNRYVFKIATCGAGASTVTSSVTAPVTSAVVSPTQHRFAEPHQALRLRTFPGPRTYSPAQRTAPQRALARTIPPRIKKTITGPAPLQIFADVVYQPTSQAHTSATTLPAVTSGSEFTLTQSTGTSTLMVPQYENTVFKKVSTVAYPSETMSAKLMDSQATMERLLLNRPITFVSPRRASVAATSPAPAGTPRAPVAAGQALAAAGRAPAGTLRPPAVAARAPAAAGRASAAIGRAPPGFSRAPDAAVQAPAGASRLPAAAGGVWRAPAPRVPHRQPRAPHPDMRSQNVRSAVTTTAPNGTTNNKQTSA